MIRALILKKVVAGAARKIKPAVCERLVKYCPAICGAGACFFKEKITGSFLFQLEKIFRDCLDLRFIRLINGNLADNFSFIQNIFNTAKAV